MNTQVLGISVDHIPCLEAWAEHLGGISFPLLSDFWPHGKVAETYGVLRPEGFSERAIFVIDRQGVICYIDIHDIDDQPSNAVLFSILQQMDPKMSFENKKEEPIPVGNLPNGKIVMYCTNWCPACRRARKWLEYHQLEFTEVDITQNRVAAAQVREWANGFETTPTFDIGGVIVVNFNEEKLREALKDQIKE